MTICIDIRNLAQKQHSGVGFYTMNLIDNLLEIDKTNQYKLFYNSKKYPHIKKYYKNVTYYDFHKSNRFLNLTMFLFNYPKINKMVNNCDIFFAQSNENNPQKIESLQYAQIGNVGMVKVNWNEKTS